MRKKEKGQGILEYALIITFALVLLVLLAMLLVPAPDPEEVLADCFRDCENNWGDHDNNPDTPMLNKAKYDKCIAECCEVYQESQ